MHFWLIRPLALELATGKVSERQAMHYYLASTLIILAGTQYALWWGPRSGWLFHFELIVLSIAAIVGTLQCWKVSGGSDFVFRAICLSVPAGLRVLVLSVVFGLVLQLKAESLFDYQTFRDPAKAYDLVSYAGFIGFSVYFWYLLYCGLSWAHKASASNGPAA